MSKGPLHAMPGRHRKQGRNPARPASSADRKNLTFARRGLLLEQPGLQKTPVVITP
jgi:hypothetical protein